jgi:hypothetical protein
MDISSYISILWYIQNPELIFLCRIRDMYSPQLSSYVRLLLRPFPANIKDLAIFQSLLSHDFLLSKQPSQTHRSTQHLCVVLNEIKFALLSHRLPISINSLLWLHSTEHTPRTFHSTSTCARISLKYAPTAMLR